MKLTLTDAAELAEDLFPVLRESLRKRSPGGARITREEGRDILEAVKAAIEREVGERL